MTPQMCAVMVKQVPERFNKKNRKLFLDDIMSCMNVDRPSIVFDCGRISQMDRDAVFLLLCCLEAAMKRNGDVKLAALSAETRSMLELNSAGHLFEIFDSPTEAVSSFRRFSTCASTNSVVGDSLLETAVHSS